MRKRQAGKYKRVDANQKRIVDGLRKIGAMVRSTAAIGSGFPDICVGFRGVNYLFEIKDGNKPPSQRKLTKDEILFHKFWAGKVYIVNSLEEAIEIIR